METVSTKIHLRTRLERDVVESIEKLSADKKVSTSDLLRVALDALEREEKLPETVLERVERLEVTLVQLVNILREQNKKEAEPAALNERQVKWLFEKLLYVFCATETTAAGTDKEVQINENFLKRKTVLGL